jgi:hypothetical protein
VTASNAPPAAGNQPRQAESDENTGAAPTINQQPSWAQSGGVGHAVAQPNASGATGAGQQGAASPS